MVSHPTLVTDIIGTECVRRVGVLTVGEKAGEVVYWLGIFSILLNCFACVRSTFLTGSPASNVDVVVDGGLVKIEMMPYAACLRKCSSLISGEVQW